MQTIGEEKMEGFSSWLCEQEKSPTTVKKYLRDVRDFCAFAGGKDITKEVVMAYKKQLLEKNYAVRSINSMLASVHSFLAYMGRADCRVKFLKLQKQVYCPEEKELTKEEYRRLLRAAEKDEQLYLVMQAICSTGIRVSELQFFTVEAATRGEICVRCKGKNRVILIPGKLRKELLVYIRKQKIRTGTIFLTKHHKPLDRKTIWAQMKSLCAEAGVTPSKVFPHNLRKLFARTFYAMEKDIAKLADILGHSSIDTTRIYIMTTGAEHRRKIERLGLVI